MGKLTLDENGIWVDSSIEKISYPDDCNEALFAIEDNSFWFRHRNNIIKRIIERFPFSGTFADIGGGNGFQSKFLSDNFSKTTLFFLEPGYQGCLNAKKRGLKHIYNVPFQKFDFVLNKVKGVGLFDVIEHIENDVDFITQLKSQLPSESFIYITVPAHACLWSDVDDYGGHYRRYNLKMIESLATKSKVELVYSSYFFSYVPLITYFLKHIPYKLRGKRDNAAILNSETQNLSPSGILLKFFDLFHTHEIKKIERGILKHGGSCIAVFKT